MYGTYMGNGKMFIAPAWGGKLVASSDDLSLVPDLLMHGAFDFALTNFILKNIQEGMTTVDIGANLGYVTVLMGYRVKSSGKVVAYEASPKNFSFLEQNVKMNYHHHTEIYQRAVSSSHNDNITFYEPERFRGSGSSKKEIVDSFKTLAPFDNLTEVTVPTVTIDEEFSDGSKIDFMKMDIEGGEYQAFLGMEKTIKEGRLSVISYEMNSHALTDELQATLELMRFYKNNMDARFFTIDGEGNLVPEDLDSIFSREHVDNAVISFV